MSTNTSFPVRDARVRLGLAQSEMAARLDISQASLSRIERGLQAPDADLAWRLSELTGLSLDELLRPFRSVA
jgi:transcriptional regulator with XRE-family HTH domain